MGEKLVLVKIAEGIATVTINRPDSLNTLTRETLEALSGAVHELAENDAARVLVVTGNGSKAFSAGADIAMMANMGPISARELAARAHRIYRTIELCEKPVIAAVNGYALGGGCELAMSCDFRIASSNAKFGQPEINIGVIPGFGGTQRLSRLVGKGKALEMMLTGDLIDAQEALRIGLVNRVVTQEELAGEVRLLAGRIAAKGRYAVKLCKEAVNNGLEMGIEQGCALETELFGLCFATQDQKEGMDAFLEKRKAVFRDC
jgi:enoyl-CoA hydratase